MERKTRYYVSRKNPLTWLMALCMVASAVVRILFACQKGMGGSGYIWGQVILPAAACLLFALICLVNGREAYYKTAIPVFMMGLYFCLYTAASTPDMGGWGLFLYCFLYFTLAAFYAVAVAGGFRHFWLLLFVYTVPVGVRVATSWSQMEPAYVWSSVVRLLPDCLFLAGLLVWHVLLPDRAQSETENRTLAQAPEFSWSALVSGKYTDAVEAYFADHFPLHHGDPEFRQ